MDSVRRISRYTEGMAEAEFLSSDITREAVARNFQILGAAAGRLPEHAKAMAPGVEWRMVCAWRDHIVHEYDRVDFSLLWQIIREEIPKLRDQLEALALKLPS